MDKYNCKSGNVSSRSRRLYPYDQQEIPESGDRGYVVNDDDQCTYPIGDSRDVDEYQDIDYTTDDEQIKYQALNREMTSRLRNKKYTTCFKKPHCIQTPRLEHRRTLHQPPAYYANENGNCRRISLISDNNVGLQYNDPRPNLVNIDKLKQHILLRKMRSKIADKLKYEKPKYETDFVKENSIKALQEVFKRNNKLNERKQIEENYRNEELSKPRLITLHERAPKNSVNLGTYINQDNVEGTSASADIPNSNCVERKNPPQTNKILNEYPTSFSYDFEKNKISSDKKHTLKTNPENSAFTRDDEIKKCENPSVYEKKDILSQKTVNLNSQSDVSIQNSIFKINQENDSLRKADNTTRSIQSKRTTSTSSKLKNYNDILKLQRSKCSIMSVIHDGQQKIETLTNQDRNQLSENVKHIETRFPIQNTNLKIDSSEEQFSLQIMKSGLLSNMFKEFRDYHLQNIVQEVKRLQYLDVLPDKLIGKNKI